MSHPSLTKPKLLAHWARDVDAVYDAFKAAGSDTGPWISDSGTTNLAAECIRLKAVGTANFSDQTNDGRLCKSESRLRRMGQGAVAAADTGSQTL
jgi:hypothetical protein